MTGSYSECWPQYLAAHADPRCRALHYAGTLGAAGCLLSGAVGLGWGFLPAAAAVGYAPAWLGHWLFERNRPATFAHPLWSLWSDLRMLGLFLSGRLRYELRRHEIAR